MKNIHLKSFFSKKYLLHSRKFPYSITYLELAKKKCLYIFLIQENVLVSINIFLRKKIIFGSVCVGQQAYIVIKVVQ